MADLGAVVDAGGGDEAEALFREAMSKQRLATFSLALRGEGSGDGAGARDFFEGLDGDGALARVVDAYRVGALDDGRAPDDAAGLDRYLADAGAACDVYVSAGRPLELFRVRALADAVRGGARPAPAPPATGAAARRRQGRGL
ncbi:hypothetical protein JL722_10615 [Aureococcus anophagefferens]|nr:hypothetical protein JL722_10615 [Aureococcus anophagefferens]